MKYAKIIGLAAVAAMALMAFVGAGTASATTLCENQQTTNCTLRVNAGSVLDFSVEKGTTLLLTNTVGDPVDTCTGGTVKGPTTIGGDTTGDTVKVFVAAADLTFTGCAGAPVTVTPGELEIHSIPGSDHGTVTATGFAVKVKAFSLVTCYYGAGTGIDLGTFTPDTVNGLKGTLHLNTVVGLIDTEVHDSSPFCPATAKWSGSYEQTSTTPIRAVAAS